MDKISGYEPDDVGSIPAIPTKTVWEWEMRVTESVDWGSRSQHY